MEQTEKYVLKIKAFIVFILFLFIAFLCFIFIGITKVDAQSFSFVRPRVISISNNWEPTETTLTICTDSLTCGSLTGTTGGNYTNLLYRINLNSEDPDISTLPVGNYSVSVKFTIRTTKYISASDIITNDISLRYYTLTSSTYSKATCDEGVSVTASNFSDSSNRIEITYKCDKLVNNRDDINFFGFTFYTDQPNTYAFVSSNLRLTDLGEATNNDVIENNNANTQDIINNQNSNTDKVVDAIQGDGLEDTTPIDGTTSEDYKEAEDKLLNEDNLNAINDIDISIDSNSSDFIWNFITRVINTHSLIFGFVITILSLGIVKLVLNR